MLLVIAIALCAFLPGIGGPFLHDDLPNIPRIKVGTLSWDSAWDVATRNDSGPLKRPLSNLALASNYWAGARTPLPYKLTNIAIHGLCALALLLLADAVLALLAPKLPRRERRLSALAAAALWAVHPLQVSTVLYVVQRMAQLPTLFLLLASWCVARWLARIADGLPARTLGMAAGYIGFTVLAVASKENGALAPLLAGTLVLAASHRLIGDTQRPLAAAQPVRGFVWWAILLPVLAGAALLATHPELMLAGYAGRDFTLVQRLLTEATLLFYYLKLFFVPWLPWMGLFHDDYPLYGIHDWQGWMAVVAWLALACGAWRLRWRWPLAAFALFWFLAAHAMESSIFPLELAYEHRNYLALVGPAIALGYGVGRLLQALPRQVHGLLLMPFLVLFGVTMHRASQWSSMDLFVTNEYAHHPESFRAILGAASRATGVGNLDEAAKLKLEIQRRRGTQIWPLMLDISSQCSDPKQVVQWSEIARRMRQQLGDDRALQFFRFNTANVVAGECKPLQVPQFVALLKLGYRKALAADDPTSAELYAMYTAWMAREAGDRDEAIAWFQRGASANPQGIEPLFDLAYYQLNNGHLDEAAAAIAALRQRERDYQLHIGYRITEVSGFLAQARQSKWGK